MAAPFKKQVKILLEKGCDFQIGVRKGTVLELRKEGYLVSWDKWMDDDSGECHPSVFSIMSYEDIVTENNYGSLKVLNRPLAMPLEPKQVRRSERVPAEVARMRFRKQFVLAIQEMLDDGSLRLVRDDFDLKIVDIVANGRDRYNKYITAHMMQEKRRGGSVVKKTDLQSERDVDFHKGFKSGHTMWKWFWQWRNNGDDGLFDSYRNCGKYARYDSATDGFICRVLNTLWDQERPTIYSYVESVKAAIESENARRERLAVPSGKLQQVGYDYVLGMIKDNAPIDHAIRKHGWDKAYRDMHAIGIGVETFRALERVEIDEYTVDLFVLMENTGLFDHLPASIRNLIGLDGSACRVTLSAAIDVHTRCLLALQIVPKALETPIEQTLEMIYMDKTAIADAAGAKFGWPMAGAPEMIVLDRGSAYVTDDAYDILASLGITNMGAPAGKPWLKPFIERIFRTIHSDLLLRFSGRAFSNVVERGENDSASRATLTLEAFLAWLVRWTVDAYHTKPHSSLGMSPAQAWAKAVKECPPRSLTNAEMREAFGVRKKRKLTRNGILMNYVYYQTDEIMNLYFSSKVEEVEVLRWDGDIGAISIRADDGPWTTVTARDPMWIGKTDTDLRVWLRDKPDQEDDERIARQDFINDVNSESYRLKRLAGLISLPKHAGDLDRDVERFSRFADTAERRRAAGEFRDLLDDLDEELKFDDSQPEPASKTAPDQFDPSVDISDEDSME